MKFQSNRTQVAIYLFLGTALGAAPAHAGLFDAITAATKSAPLELKDGADKADTFTKAFSDSGALAREVKRAEIAERKIAITSFQVEFAIEQVGQVSDAGGSDAEKIYTLVGVTPERLQTITDAAYTAFVATLTKRGFEVLPQTVLETGVFKAELANANQPPVKKERGGFSKVTTAGGGHRAELDKDNFGYVATAKGTSPDVWNAAFKTPAALKLADELGAAAVEVRLKLNFARMDDSGAAGKSEQPQNTLGIKSTRMQVYAPGSKWVNYELKKPVMLPGRAADKAVEIASTGGETAVAAASAGASVVFGFLKGGLSGAASNLGSAARLAGGSGKFSITADSDYDAKTGKDLVLAVELMAEALPK
jgi:hypothetical protein